MNTGLAPEVELTIVTCALRFDGYNYAEVQHPGVEHPHAGLAALLRNAQVTGKFSTRSMENFAANFYLHRCFHGHGTLPAQFAPEWYDMVFYYLHLYRVPTPAIYRHASTTEWDQRPKGAAERAAAEIRFLLRRHR
jgi:hypothetical protein